MNWDSQQFKNGIESMKSVMCKRLAVTADGAKRPKVSFSAVITVRSYATDRPIDRHLFS